MNAIEIAELRREAAELRARVTAVEEEVDRLHAKIAILPEHTVSLAYIKEHITEVKANVTQFNEQMAQLRIDNAVLTKKVAWIVGAITTGGTLLVKNGPEWIKQLSDLLK